MDATETTMGTDTGVNTVRFQIAAVDTGDDGTEDHNAAVRVFGRTAEGGAVSVRVSGFLPYFFVRSDDPQHVFALLQRLERQHEDSLIQDAADGDAGANGGRRPFQREPPRAIDVRHAPERTMSLTHYADRCAYVRVDMAKPSMVPAARDFLFRHRLQVAEASVPFEIRYCIDRAISGACWVEASGPRGAFDSVWHVDATVPDALRPLPAEEQAALGLPPMAPFKVLSFDIECLPPLTGGMPTPEEDPVIQVACVLARADSLSTPYRQVVIVLGGCAPIPGVEVLACTSERGVLERWAALLTGEDPDFVVGYNSSGFDLPYLARRWELLMRNQPRAWGRVPGERSRVKVHSTESRAHGQRENKEVMMAGRVDLDIMLPIKKEHKLRSYTLNSVSAHFLGDQKEDVSHTQIRPLHESGPEDRRRLARYCLKDALLPLRLCAKLMTLPNLVAMSAVTGVTPTQIIQRGMQFQVMSLILRHAGPEGYAVPTLPPKPSDNKSSLRRENAYEGATVLEPRRGFHQRAIATLDFASLYPSIMMAHNLCYSSLLPAGHPVPPGLGEDDITVTPVGARFVKARVMQGLLPRILQALITARGNTRKEMKSLDKTDFRYHVLEGRQLAFKICANSVYGFTGALTGVLPCLPISSSVTAFGRRMIDETKHQVEQLYPGSEVLYGDTDSVMVLFAGITGMTRDDIARAMELGLDASVRITKVFIAPIRLEFEKVFAPFLLMAKKRYAGVLFASSPDRPDKIDVKGAESTRRDNCPLVRHTVDGIFRRLLKENDRDGAIRFAADRVRQLREGRVDLAHLIVSKSLSRRPEDYANPKSTGHVVLAATLRKRDPGSAPRVGDRVPFVLLRAHKNAKAFERIEDPTYALEHNLPVDHDHYLTTQLQKPLLRILGPVFQRPTDTGTARAAAEAATRLGLTYVPPRSGNDGSESDDDEDDAKDGPDDDKPDRCAVPVAALRRSRAGPASSLSPLARQLGAVAVQRCMACNATVEGSAALCRPVSVPAEPRSCESRRPELWMAAVRERDSAASAYTACWAGCQRCQGSLLSEVTCAARDCPVFYIREQLKKDLAVTNSRVRRLAASEALDWFL